MSSSRTASEEGPSGDGSSSASSASGETARNIPSYASVASSNLSPTSPSLDEMGATPTPTAGAHLATPPSQARTAAAVAAGSPAPTSSPTPNPHRRTHSSTSSGPPSAPLSAVSSPARREFTPGDLSDSVLHEESGEDEEGDYKGDDLFNAASSLQRQPSARGGSSLLAPGGVRSRPPSAAQNQQSYRRSISVNTSASSTSAGAATSSQPPQPRHSLYHPQSQAGLSSAPSHSSSRVRNPQDSRNRSISRGGRPPPSTTASETEEGSEGEDWPRFEEIQRRGRAFSPAPPGNDERDDDEVERRDRGEELVRKRMRERKVRSSFSFFSYRTSLTLPPPQQEARRVARAADRQRQQQQQQRLSSYTSYLHTPSADTEHGPNALGLGYPAAPSASLAPGSAARARDTSLARSEAYSLFSDSGLRSPVLGGGGAPYSPLPLPAHAYSSAAHSVPLGSTPNGRPQLGGRGSSYVSNASSSFPFHAGTARSRGGSTAPSVIEGSDTGGELTEGDGESTAEDGEETDGLGHEPRLEDWHDGGADGTHIGGSDSEEDGDDVEYTLKDRQDARSLSVLLFLFPS